MRAIVKAKMSEKLKSAWADRASNGLGSRLNGALFPDVQKRISESVKTLWNNGAYDDRVNGMTGLIAGKHHNWMWGKWDYRSILSQFEKKLCSNCGESKKKIDAHHLDENRGNYLLTNLQWVCVPCHAWLYHYKENKAGRGKRFRLPFISLTKEIGIEYAHILPWHPGKCGQLHGHSGKLKIEIRGRVNPNGVVCDFSEIGNALKAVIHERFDHKFLNDFIPNSTSENFLVYAWIALEQYGLKGMNSLSFKETDSSQSTLTAESLRESYGWTKRNNEWIFCPKAITDGKKIPGK